MTLATAQVSGQLTQWDGWAVLIAAAIFGYRRATLWSPLVVALIVNPIPYGLLAAAVHWRHLDFASAALFSAVRVGLACGGFAVGAGLRRLR